MAEERILTLNLRKKLEKTPKWMKSEQLSKILKYHLEKQTKTKVKLSKEINEKIWRKGMQNPSFKLRIRLVQLEDKTFKAELVK